MADLKLERTLNADQARVFEFVTQPHHLVKWCPMIADGGSVEVAEYFAM